MTLPDGKNAIDWLLWKPDYAECYKNRTMKMEKCSTRFFDPVQRKCTDKANPGECCILIFVWHSALSFTLSQSRNDFSKNYIIHIMFSSLGNIDEICKQNPKAILRKNDNCAQYYNCSVSNSSYGGHLQECKYPDLFSTVSMGCENFKTVTCDNRTEPQAPCKFWMLRRQRIYLNNFIIGLWIIVFQLDMILLDGVF